MSRRSLHNPESPSLETTLPLRLQVSDLLGAIWSDRVINARGCARDL